MVSEEYALQRYSKPFHRHLSFFDRNHDGFIYFADSLRGNLAIGLDFPVAVGMAIGYHAIYGNVRPFYFGPFNPIEISKVRAQRDMLERVNLDDIPARGMGRKTLLAASAPTSQLDKLHVNGLWAFAADRHGMISPPDVERYQKGIMLYELERRRKDNRDHVLPLHRGGPISVSGHSWFVEKLFGVKVYQQGDKKKAE